MKKKFLIKRPTPLHQFPFSSNLSTEKSTDRRNNILSSTNPKTTSRKHPPSPCFFGQTKSILKRNQTQPLFNTTKKLNSVIVSHKDKLEAFTTLIDDIYRTNKAQEDKSDIEKLFEFRLTQKKAYMTSVRPSVTAIEFKRPMSFSHQKKIKPKLKVKALDLKPKTLLRANVSSSNVVDMKKMLLRPDMFIKKNRMVMNRFILKVLDPEACLDDYTPDKGTQRQYFNKFKLKLQKETRRLTSLINDIKKAESMNETFLKFYVVKLRNAESKFYNIPKANSNPG